MRTEYSPGFAEFEPVERQKVVAGTPCFVFR